jgi:amino-acid N-acetyltransferase
MAEALEVEARVRKCRAVYLLTATDGAFFARLGYEDCGRAAVPAAIRATRQFAKLCPEGAIAMTKSL